MGYRETTKFTSIYVSNKLLDLATEVAQRRGISRNRLVVEAIREAVEREVAGDLGAGGSQVETKVVHHEQ